MKAFVAVEPYDLSKSVHRVADALVRFKPNGVKIVVGREDADLVVRHVTGFPETEVAIANAKAAGQDIALLQYCLRSTQQPSTAKWLPLWQQAKLVWSYYGLADLCFRDGIEADFSWLSSPLGVDGSVFHPNGEARRYRIGTSGYVSESEGIAECAEAVRRLGAKQFHLGPELIQAEHVVTRIGLDDAEVAAAWAHCEYVSGLRRIEGFELPAAEGLACGARPIMFDHPCYRRWFNDFAVFIPEVESEALADSLTAVLAEPAKAVSATEREAVLERFSWKKFATEFWELVL